MAFKWSVICLCAALIEAQYPRDVPLLGLNPFGQPLVDSDYVSGDEIPGVAGADYPVYDRVPATGFTCEAHPVPGYYADPLSGCQAFYICGESGRGASFLCPNGTVFNQKELVCDWWYNFDCGLAEQYYAVNDAVVAAMAAVDASNGVLNPTSSALVAAAKLPLGVLARQRPLAAFRGSPAVAALGGRLPLPAPGYAPFAADPAVGVSPLAYNPAAARAYATPFSSYAGPAAAYATPFGRYAAPGAAYAGRYAGPAAAYATPFGRYAAPGAAYADRYAGPAAAYGGPAAAYAGRYAGPAAAYAGRYAGPAAAYGAPFSRFSAPGAAYAGRYAGPAAARAYATPFSSYASPAAAYASPFARYVGSGAAAYGAPFPAAAGGSYSLTPAAAALRALRPRPVYGAPFSSNADGGATPSSSNSGGGSTPSPTSYDDAGSVDRSYLPPSK